MKVNILNNTVSGTRAARVIRLQSKEIRPINSPLTEASTTRQTMAAAPKNVASTNPVCVRYSRMANHPNITNRASDKIIGKPGTSDHAVHEPIKSMVNRGTNEATKSMK